MYVLVGGWGWQGGWGGVGEGVRVCVRGWCV
jgi:hypothetical protein